MPVRKLEIRGEDFLIIFVRVHGLRLQRHAGIQRRHLLGDQLAGLGDDRVAIRVFQHQRDRTAFAFAKSTSEVGVVQRCTCFWIAWPSVGWKRSDQWLMVLFKSGPEIRVENGIPLDGVARNFRKSRPLSPPNA